MSRSVLILVVLVLAMQSALADRSDDIASFNNSWSAYQEAIETGNSAGIAAAAGATVAAGRKIFDDDDERLPKLYINHGKALIADDQMKAGQKALKEALYLSEHLYGKNALELVDILWPLGDGYAENAAPALQLKYYDRALEIVEQEFGRESFEFANLSMQAATQVYALSQSVAGYDHLSDAREIFAVVSGEDSKEVGITDYFLAKFEFTRGRHEQAVEYALDAVPKLEGDSAALLNMQMRTRALLVQAYEEQGMTDAATPHCMAIGRISKLRPDQDHQPLFRMTPKYPASLLDAGVEGHVDFEFTVDENGFVRDPHVIDQAQTHKSSITSRVRIGDETDLSFEAAALEALERFRYAPMFVDGVATPVEEVKTRISFKIDD